MKSSQERAQELINIAHNYSGNRALTLIADALDLHAREAVKETINELADLLANGQDDPELELLRKIVKWQDKKAAEVYAFKPTKEK